MADDSETRAMLVRLLREHQGQQRLEQTHSLRGKTCPIQRPGLKR